MTLKKRQLHFVYKKQSELDIGSISVCECLDIGSNVISGKS